MSITLCILAFIVFFSGCPTGGESVLWTLKSAELQIDNSLNNSLTILGMAIDANVMYYIACGPIMYQRPVGGNSWTSVGFPAGAMYCSSIAYFGGRLYAGFIKGDGTGDLYSTDPSVQPINWGLPESDTDINGKQIDKLWVAGGSLVVSAIVVSGGTSSFTAYFRNGAAYDPVGATAITSEVVSVIHDGANFWALTKNQIYSGGALNSLAVFTPTTPPTGTFAGMLNSGANYYISNTDGYVFISADGCVTWTASPQQSMTKAIIFTEIARIDTKILIGARNYGFYQMDDGDTTFASLIRSTDFINSDLYMSSTRNFFIDTVNSRVFFCTEGDGLFNNTFTNPSWGTSWTHE